MLHWRPSAISSSCSRHSALAFSALLWLVGSIAHGQAAPAADAGALPPPAVVEAGATAPGERSADSGVLAPAPSATPDAGVISPDSVVPVAPGPVAPAAQEPPAGRRARPSATLRGTIFSAADEVPVDGATVYVRGTHEQVQTDANGAFTLSLPAGTYQVSVINPGYSTQNVSNVELRPNQTAELNLKLQPGSVELDEMVVTGSRVKGGIATLIAERRESKQVADVIGAEQMSRSGDSNAASALSRVTGITIIDGRYVIVRGMGERYSTMTLNRLQVASPDPTRRVVPLDIFPAGVIDSVVVQKSYSPDLPGEFGGGLVQLRSRDYPHEFSLNVNLALGGNFNNIFRDRLTYEAGKYDFLGVDDGERELPKQFDDPRGKITTGLLSEYSDEEVVQFGRDLPRRYNTHNRMVVPDMTLGANVGNEWRLRYAKLGFVTAFGYRNETRSVEDAINRSFKANKEDYRVDTYRRQINLSGFLDWGVTFSALQKLKFTTMLLRQTDDSAQFREDLLANKDRTVLQWVERQVFLQQINGSHGFEKLHKFQVDWRYAYGLASRQEPMRGQYEYIYENDKRVFAPQTGNANVFSDMDDQTHEASLDLSQPFPLWRHLEGKAKLGGLFYRRDRNANTRSFSYTVSQDVDRDAPPDSVVSDENIGNGIAFDEVTLATDSYDADMQVEAGYANLDLALHKSVDLNGGVRMEHAHINVLTFDPFNPNSGDKVGSKLDNLDWLPGVSLTWRFIQDFQARAGYSRTLNRPDFRELSPSRYYDLESNLLLVGNPDVKRARIENYDVRFEWFYTPDEVFSLGGFLKRFDDPIENVVQRSQDDVYTVENADEAISYGLELEGRKRLGFLAKVLNPLYLAANFSLINSKVEVPIVMGGEVTGMHARPLQGQSPWVINAQLGWDDTDGTGTVVTLLFNSAGKRIRFVGDPGFMLGDIYELPVHRLDLVFSQKLPRGFKLGARVRNILNAREKWVAKDADGVEQTWRYFRRGADFQVSASWNY